VLATLFSMKKLLVVLNFALIITGCGSSPESLTEELIGKANELVVLLEQVVDQESAEQNKDQIESLGAEVKKLLEELSHAIEQLDEEQKKEFQQQFKERWGKSAGKLFQQTLRLAMAPYGKSLPSPWADDTKQPDM
jgi:hypothetical protein